MGFVGKLRGISLSLAVLALAPACVTSDPAAPCRAMDLGEAEPAAMVSRTWSPVLAVSTQEPGAEPFVLHYVCADGSDTSCRLARTDLEGVGHSQVMITTAGNYVVAIDPDTHALSWFQLGRDGLATRGSTPISPDTVTPYHLVASLRQSDWLIVRDEERRLARYWPGETQGTLIADDIDGLAMVAVGERNVVARQVKNGDMEALYLLPAHPDANASKPIRLVQAKRFSRVVIGPRDETVIATSGKGASATTFVFSGSDGTLLDRFAGAAVSGQRALEELPGMRAVSPDGSKLAYRTKSGAVALRDLESHNACLVRSSSAGDHTVAGFSAQGMLYMEASEGIGRTRIIAFDPSTRQLAALSDPADRQHLAAVPGRDAASDRRPWAIGVRDGAFAALQDDSGPKGLKLNEALFMPRDDTNMWVISTTDQDTDGLRRMALRRVRPQRNGARGYDFDASDSVSPHLFEDGDDRGAFEHPLRGPRACLSVGSPGLWGVSCANVGAGDLFELSAPPSSEDPTNQGDRDPDEIPSDGSSSGGLCFGGQSLDNGLCPGVVATFEDDTQCCYPDSTTACFALCASSVCNENPATDNTPASVYCVDGVDLGGKD